MYFKEGWKELKKSKLLTVDWNIKTEIPFKLLVSRWFIVLCMVMAEHILFGHDPQ